MTWAHIKVVLLSSALIITAQYNTMINLKRMNRKIACMHAYMHSSTARVYFRQTTDRETSTNEIFKFNAKNMHILLLYLKRNSVTTEHHGKERERERALRERER